jgi:hypothetical protein
MGREETVDQGPFLSRGLHQDTVSEADDGIVQKFQEDPGHHRRSRDSVWRFSC